MDDVRYIIRLIEAVQFFFDVIIVACGRDQISLEKNLIM